MNRRGVHRRSALVVLVASSLFAVSVMAAEEAPDVLIRRLYADVMERIKSDKLLQAGDISRALALVDNLIMPHVDFQRMTASAVGPAWRRATAEQKSQLIEQFNILLVRTYAGALLQANDRVLVVKPIRMAKGDTQVIVRTEARGSGDPIQLDCRLAKKPDDTTGWKIYDLNVMGVWLGEIYRNQFAQEINAKGLDGLIKSLNQRNQSSVGKG